MAATAFLNRDMLFTLGAHSIWTNNNIEENTVKMREGCVTTRTASKWMAAWSTRCVK
jgi:hypothetical protein